MALGNPIRINSIPERPVVLIRGKLDMRDNQPFWRRKIFDIPNPSLLAHLFSSKNPMQDSLSQNISDYRVKSPFERLFLYSKGSVDEALFTVTDTLSIGTANGSEAVEVAFQHVVFVSGQGGVCDKVSQSELEQKISESLSTSLKGYFDPTIGIRVQCLVNPVMHADEVNMYVGQGVFTPHRGEQPIGWLRYYPDPTNRDQYSEPIFQDGRPAGIYKGQNGLAIGTVENLLHTEFDLGGGQDIHSSFIFVKGETTQGSDDADSTGSNINARLSFCRGDGNEPVPTPVNHLDSKVDFAWRIDFVGTAKVPGRLELCVDDRPSRLYGSKHKECNAAISALRFDLSDFSGRDVDRLWINLDQNNILIAYNLQVTRRSLVWDRDQSEPYIYEWDQVRSPFKKPGNIGLKCRIFDDDIIEIARADGKPFGYLELPEAADQVIFSDENQSFGGYHLDWLDECGRISDGDEITSLGEAYSDKCSGMQIKAFDQGQSKMVVGPLVLAPVNDDSEP